MSDVNRLRSLFVSGKLLHPKSDALSMVDFANALHSAMGVPDITLGEKALNIRERIGGPEHLVVALVDGFGMNFVNELDEDAFMPNHLVAEMRTVFPSTTPIALTTLATGEWPGKHAVVGWFQRLEQIDAVSTIISYIRTGDRKPLSELGVSVGDAYPVESRIGLARQAAVHIYPQHIAGSTYSNYWTGSSTQVGYDPDSPEQAIRLAQSHIRAAREPTCTYLYLPQVDSLAHKLGSSHERTLEAARQMDALLGGLANDLPPDSRLVMTADHGHLDAPEAKTYKVSREDEIMRYCHTLTGDQRAAYAHIVEGKIDAFKSAIRDKCGDDFLVISSDDVEDLGLLGPVPLAQATRSRIGDALVLSAGEAVLDYRAALGDALHPMLSHHGGLTPAEMRIPLVVA